MLVNASWIDNSKPMLGLEGVSQVWSEAPAWYFWIHDAEGVYHLDLQSFETVGSREDNLVSGLFSIRFYPFRHGPLFRGLSHEEQRLIESDHFDSTNTPDLASLSQIPTNLFQIGTLEMLVSAECPHCPAIFSLEALDVVRLRSEVDAELWAPSLSQAFTVGAGETIKSVEGWSVAHRLFDTALRLHALFTRQKPARATMSRAMGFEGVYCEKGGWSAQDSEEIDILTLRVQFSGEHKVAPVAASHRLTSPGYDVLWDVELPSDYPHDLRIEGVEDGVLSPMWWRMAEIEHRSSLASTCGCH